MSPPSKVYFTRQLTPEALVRAYEVLGVPATGRVAVKISTGEPGGHNYLKPELIKDLVQKVNGTIVESNTAYHGKRLKTEDHYQTCESHGFTAIAKCDILDGDPDSDLKIPVRDTTHLQYNLVGGHLQNYDFMINLAHFKGHAMGGYGGVLKNQSIGVASSAGKTYIHAAGKTSNVSEIWKNIAEQDKFLESMAAAAQSVSDYLKGKILYINVLNNLSIDCDCDSNPHDPEMKDIGIMSSLDPVALDQASVDLIFNHKSTEGDNSQPLIQRINEKHGIHTIEHAEKIGLGTRKYEIVNLD